MKFSYKELSTTDDVLRLIRYHNDIRLPVALDTETTGLDPRKDKLLKIILTGYDDSSACMFDAEFATCLNQLDPKVPLILHNFKFDFHFLMYAGVDLRKHTVTDTMLLHHLLDETAPHGLDAIVQGIWQDSYKEKFWEANADFASAPSDQQLEYACKDVIYTKLIYKSFLSEIATSQIPQSLIESTHRLALALYDTELLGVKVDVDFLISKGAELKQQILEKNLAMHGAVTGPVEVVRLRNWVKELEKRKTDKGRAGVPKPEFSFDSQKQVMQLLYDTLKLPVQTNEKTKKPSVDDDALSRIQDKHLVIPMLRDYRGVQKVYTSYIEGTLERKHGDRIYPSFNINGCVTGRISSSNPNLQQLPRDGGIRGIYIPDPGFKFVSSDYKQLEIVIAAHFSQDRNLLKIVLEGASQHDITAEGLKVPRSTAKSINFAMQYGAGVGKIQSILSCSKKDAELAWNKYWETYSGLKALIDDCHAKVNSGDAVVTPFGRHRRFPTEWPEPWMKGKAKRQAFNFLIQGTGADITHCAYGNVWRIMKLKGWGRSLLEVHDEIVIMPSEACVEKASEMLKYEMVAVGTQIGLKVPLSVDCSGPMDRWED
jgi:DNA polymerase-1